MDEIPFFDTNYLCDPSQATNISSYEEEIEPWDAPLRRRDNVSTHISSNLYQPNRRESHYSEIGSDDGILVNEPFNRDPDLPMKKMNARRYSNSPRASISSSPCEDNRPVSYSPTLYATPNVGNLREKLFGAGDNQVYKKRSAPQPPVGNYNDTNQGIDKFEQRPAKKAPAPTPPRPTSPYRPTKYDPIREMESYGIKEVARVSVSTLQKLF